MLDKIEILPYANDLRPLNFSCREEKLDSYLLEQAGQDIRRRIASCYLARLEEKVIGYYTLSSTAFVPSELPEKIARKLPSYPHIPAVLLGRLAVEKTFQGKRVGEFLLVDAIQRVMRSEIAAYAVIVKAKNERARSFYQHFGFISFLSDPLTLFLPLKTFEKQYLP